MSIRDQIDNANDLGIIETPTPKWGKVFIRFMSAADRLTLEQLIEDKKFSFGAVIVRGLCEADGTRCYKDEEASIIDAKPVDLVLDLYTKCKSHNALSALDVEEAKKNSAGDSAVSSETSPSI